MVDRESVRRGRLIAALEMAVHALNVVSARSDLFVGNEFRAEASQARAALHGELAAQLRLVNEEGSR